ncbi:hypothetical protein IWX50DRAFT_99890 [Phyllosticta citricarpa]
MNSGSPRSYGLDRLSRLWWCWWWEKRIPVGCAFLLGSSSPPQPILTPQIIHDSPFTLPLRTLPPLNTLQSNRLGSLTASTASIKTSTIKRGFQLLATPTSTRDSSHIPKTSIPPQALSRVRRTIGTLVGWRREPSKLRVDVSLTNLPPPSSWSTSARLSCAAVVRFACLSIVRPCLISVCSSTLRWQASDSIRTIAAHSINTELRARSPQCYDQLS